MVELRLAIAYIFCAVIALGLSYYGLITVREKCEQGDCSREPKAEADVDAQAGKRDGMDDDDAEAGGGKRDGMEAFDKPWQPGGSSRGIPGSRSPQKRP